MAIPLAIHQTWRTAEVPAEWQPHRASWSTQHPGWSSTLWTDEECRALVATARPALLDHYDAFPLSIQRADTFRYVLLADRGGVYVDLDFECLRSLDPLLRGAQVVLGLEPAVHADDDAVRARGLDRIVCNAFLASVPGHPFWDHVLSLVAAADPGAPVLDSTGVFLLSRAVDTYPHQEQLTLAGADVLYPMTKWEAWAGGPVGEELAHRLTSAVAVHHWSSSWQRDRLQAAAHHLAERRARRRVV